MQCSFPTDPGILCKLRDQLMLSDGEGNNYDMLHIWLGFSTMECNDFLQLNTTEGILLALHIVNLTSWYK